MDFDPQFRAPDGSAIRIWIDTSKNNFASEKQGRPIYDEVLMLEVIAPGSKGSTPVFEAERIFHETVGISEPHRAPQYETYKAQIEAFKSNEHATNVSGTPLKEWPEISRSLAASLKEARIYSVEALAQLPDSRLNAVGPDGRSWREKAIAWLESTRDGAAATKYAAENEQLRADVARRDGDISALSEQLAQMQAQIAALQGGQGGQTTPQATQAPPAPKPAPTGGNKAPLPTVDELAKANQSGDTIPAGKTIGDII